MRIFKIKQKKNTKKNVFLFLYVLIFCSLSSSSLIFSFIKNLEAEEKEDTSFDAADFASNIGIATQMSSSITGAIKDEQTKNAIQASMNVVSNGAMATSSMVSCSGGNIGSCVMAALFTAQTGLSFMGFKKSKKNKNILSDTSDTTNSDPCFGAGGLTSQEECQENEIPLPYQLTSNTKKLKKMGYKMSKDNKLTLPDGRTFPGKFDEESLKGAGFNAEEIQSIKNNLKKSNGIGLEAIKKFQEDLENGDDKVEILGTEYRISNLGFNSTRGFGGATPRFFSKRKSGRSSFSSLFKRLQRKNKKAKKIKKHFTKSNFKRKFGKDRIGVGFQSIFDLIHNQYKNLNKQNYFKKI